MNVMGVGAYKPLAVSLALHGVAAGAFAWSLSVLLEPRRAEPERAGQRIVLSPEMDASKGTFEQLVTRPGSTLEEIERPRMERPPEAWSARVMPRATTPHAAAHPVAEFQATVIGVPTGQRVGRLGAGPMVPEAAPIAVGTGGGGAGGPATAMLSAGGTAVDGGGGDLWGAQGPVPLDGNPKPVYPRRLEREGIGGTTKVLMIVSELGRVDEATVLESSGYDAMDESALATARKRRFKAVGTGTSTTRVTWEVNFNPSR